MQVPLVDCHAHIGSMETDYMSVSAERLLTEQRRYGIVASLISSFEALRGALVEGNEHALRLAEQHASIYVWLVLNPRRMGLSERLLEQFGSHEKVLGVKVHPVLHGYDLEMRMLRDLLDTIRPWRLPVLSHTQTEATQSGMALRRLAETYPDLTFIAAHFGIARRGPGERVAEIWDNTAPPNLLTDMATQRSSEYGFFGYAVRTIGAPRILWGSDATCVETAAMLGVLLFSDISEDDRAAIAHGNAMQLFGARLRV